MAGANTTAAAPEPLTEVDVPPDDDFGDPFASFTEWAQAEDEAAWAYLSDLPTK